MKEDNRTRLDELKAIESPLIDMPSVTADYLLADWFKLGLAASGANGATPQSWQEIEAFIRLSGLRYATWEVESLHAMSKSYCNQLYASKLESEPPPYMDESEEAHKLRQLAEMRAIKAGFSNAF